MGGDLGGSALQLTRKFGAASWAMKLFTDLVCDGYRGIFVQTEAWRNTATRENSMIVGSTMDLLVVEVIWDAGTQVREILWAKAAAHVYEHVDVGAQRDDKDGEAPAVVEGVALSRVLLLYPAPVARDWAIVLPRPCVDTCSSQSMFLSDYRPYNAYWWTAE